MVKENKDTEIKEAEKACKCCDRDKKGLIAGIIILVAIGIAVLIIALCGGKKSNEEELKKNLKTLGAQFYEKFYYPAQEKSQKDVKEFISKFSNTGIKVNLENIAKISVVDKELVESMVNSKTEKECDKVATYVVIKPKKPFGKTDYTVETVLSCGFEDSKKEASKKEETTKKTETKKEETTKKEDTTKKVETTKKEVSKKTSK